jgi:hypothetical protein
MRVFLMVVGALLMLYGGGCIFLLGMFGGLSNLDAAEIPFLLWRGFLPLVGGLLLWCAGFRIGRKAKEERSGKR